MTVLLTSGLLVGCGGVLTGLGNLKTEEYNFSGFDKVEIRAREKEAEKIKKEQT
ncbi:hypothetical protein ACFLWG_04440 [Chloroflexota bacterium]